MPPKASSSSTKATSNAGIVTTEKGETYIPASVRADGSVRKEIRVRAGYRPPEDVEKYKNRTAEAWKNRGTGGIPGAEAVEDEDAASAAAKGKNAKRREARRRAKEAAADGEAVDGEEEDEKQPQELGEEAGEDKSNTEASTSKEKAPDTPAATTAEDEEAAREKLARNLKKKLRQAKDLSARREGGEALLPEQLEKIIRINELVRQLNALGVDAGED